MMAVFNGQVSAADSDPRERVGGFAVVLVAHPDDESIFFHATIKRLVAAGAEVSVVCATGVFEDAATEAVRLGEFEESCRRLGVRGRTLGLRDRPGARLEMPALLRRLRAIASDFAGASVYTHSPWGDYGHRHHVDVAVAAHEVFESQVRFLAGPLAPVELAILTEEEFACKIAHTKLVYGSQAFAHTWCTRVEAFACLDRHLVRYLAELSQPRLRRALAPVSVQSPRVVASVARQFVSGFSQAAPLPAELERIPYPVWSAKIARLRRRLARAVGLQAAPFIRPWDGRQCRRGDLDSGDEVESLSPGRLESSSRESSPL